MNNNSWQYTIVILDTDDNSAADGRQDESSTDVFHNGRGHGAVSLSRIGALWLHQWGEFDSIIEPIMMSIISVEAGTLAVNKQFLFISSPISGILRGGGDAPHDLTNY